MNSRLFKILTGWLLLAMQLVASEANSSPSLEPPYESDPFPIGKLKPEILNKFMPFILAEVEQEFSHQNDTRTRRDTREYGFSFFKMLDGDFSYTPPPEVYQQLGAHICQALGHDPIEFTNIILSVYEKDFYLEPHVDVSLENLYNNASFYFDERVYGLVIEPDPTGHLYFVQWEGEGLVPPLDLEPVYSLEEDIGTLFCLEGPLRQTPYFHGVSAVSNRRISLTFRTTAFTNSNP